MQNKLTKEEVIKCLNLIPLPGEGGYFRRTYEAPGTFPATYLKPGLQGTRRFSTAIYYFVTPNEFSSLHRLPQDEIFHFYFGDPVEMIQISQNGELQRFSLGDDIRRGQFPQVVAPGNTWQGTRLQDGGEWALLGTTVSPGFEFCDLEVGKRQTLIQLFPQHGKDIVRFTVG